MQRKHLAVLAGCIVVAVALAFLSTAGADETDASYYGVGDGLAGNLTASGEPMNPFDYTAAHPYLPMGTELEVCRNLKCVQPVRINDVGPFANGRGLDLSWAVAADLDMLEEGHGLVSYSVLSLPV